MELFNANSKLASVIHKNHSLLPVINRLGVRLGFGDKTIRNVCEEQGIDLNFFVETINVFHYEAYFPEKRLLDFPVSMVINYLIKTHQYYKDFLIPESDRLIELFLSSSSENSADNQLVRKFHARFKEEFVIHINFSFSVEVNGTTIPMMVDTGASSMVLSFEDARKLGLDPDRLAFSATVMTANGRGRSL